MEQYIKKSAVVAEIERRRDYYKRNPLLVNAKYCIDEDNAILKLLDTLEVKEVDDEKCKEYDKALSIAKSWYKSSDSSAQERNVARMIMGDKVREKL